MSFSGRLLQPGEVARVFERILDRIRRDAPELLAGFDAGADPVAAIRQALQVEES